MTSEEKIQLKGALDTAYRDFETLGIKPMLLGHTLLFAYRDHDFVDSPQANIVDLGCFAEDITKEIREKLFAGGHFQSSLQSNVEHSLMYFRYNDRQVELLPLFKFEDIRFLNMVPSVFHVWPANLCDKYGEIEFLGTKYRTVGNIEGWLRTYYGSTWNVKDDNFRWQGAANKCDMSNKISYKMYQDSTKK